jgi:hypothetical protein
VWRERDGKRWKSVLVSRFIWFETETGTETEHSRVGSWIDRFDG